MDWRLRITLLILFAQVFSTCNSDIAPECFKNMGSIISYDVTVPDFTSIHVGVGVEVIITQGDVQKVTIQTGENIKEYITATVSDGGLNLINNNNCNWVRDYKSTTVYVTTPHLDKIYSASQFAVKSNGVLTFPSLSLMSGVLNETASGTFELDINCQRLIVEDNQSCYFLINGMVDELFVKFYSGDARFEGSGLVAQKLEVFHRSSNDIIANVQEEAKGILYGTGNLILKNHPIVVTIEQTYTGKVVYE